MRGLIVSNGDISNYTKLSSLYKSSEYVICADGGVRHLIEINEKPDMVLGDLDSISIENLEYIKKENIKTEKFPPEKDKTDTELAMDYLIEKGCTEISFIGVTGSRQDHTMANIFLLYTLLQRKIKGIIFDDNNTIYVVDDLLCLEKKENTYISIVPISEAGIRLSITGFFYDLNNCFMPFGSTHGISNEVLGEMGKIQIHTGKALVIESID